MIFHPAVIALLLGSALVTLMILYSATHGIRILQRWDLRSGSELQLELERKTYLLSTIMSYVFGFQLISFFLFIFTEDELHALFVGAMCAAGTLNANVYGYPAILLKVVNFLLAGTWLIMNYTDNRAYDYPLVRKKYFLLAIIAPLVIAESVLLGAHFFSLKTNIITSCCGSLFSPEEGGIASEIASLPSMPMKIIFYLSMGLTLLSGARFYLRGRTGVFFSVMSTLTFFVAAASLISFISLYFYELPTHHCPFCIFQKEYGYVGYLLYIALLCGAVSGLGVGAITSFRNVQSLAGIIPAIQKKLALTALLCYLLFTLIVTYKMLFSDFILEGY